MEMALWHCGHVTHIRKFVAAHPTHSLIELDLYDTNQNAKIMSTLFNTKKSCWGHSNEHKKYGIKREKVGEDGRRLFC